MQALGSYKRGKMLFLGGYRTWLHHDRGRHRRADGTESPPIQSAQPMRTTSEPWTRTLRQKSGQRPMWSSG
jgi:hypothetical protein